MRHPVFGFWLIGILPSVLAGQILPPGATPQLLTSGYRFTEGPLFDHAGGLYFSDLDMTYVQSRYAEVGGLMSYGRDNVDYWRLGAAFMDRIFKGARPGDLPFEQPATFQLVLNMKTARALGVKIPQATLLQATKVIE